MNPSSRVGPDEESRGGRSRYEAEESRGGRSRYKGFLPLVAVGAVVILLACSSMPSGRTSEPSATSADATVLVGWLHTVWNGSPTHYLLIAADSTVQLLLDKETAQPPGSPFSLDGRRVEVEGVPVGRDRVRVSVLQAARRGGS